MKYDYLLPIGSVVKLKEAERQFMIHGYLQVSSKNKNKIYDYVAVPYPEGLQDVRLTIGFNHDLVEEVIFRGYENEDRKAVLWLMEVSMEYQKKQNEENKTV